MHSSPIASSGRLPASSVSDPSARRCATTAGDLGQCGVRVSHPVRRPAAGGGCPDHQRDHLQRSFRFALSQCRRGAARQRECWSGEQSRIDTRAAGKSGPRRVPRTARASRPTGPTRAYRSRCTGAGPARESRSTRIRSRQHRCSPERFRPHSGPTRPRHGRRGRRRGAPPAQPRTRASADLSFDFVIGNRQPALAMVCPNTLPGINGSKRRGGGTRFAGRVPQPART